MNLRRRTAPLMALNICPIGVSNSVGRRRSGPDAMLGGFGTTHTVGTSFADEP